MALTKVQAAGLTADLIDETKLADNSIDSEHYNDGSIDEAHLADDAVTADKLANSINSEIAANTAKATNATHTGDVTGSGALTIADNAVTLAKMASGTDGQIITYDASGDPIAVGPGTDGQVLTSTGAGSPPAFEDLPTSGATLSGSTDNTVVTVTGSNAMQGESNVRIDSSGRLLTGGQTTSVADASSLHADIQSHSADGNGLSLGRYAANAYEPYMTFFKSRNATIGSNGTIVQDGDSLGTINWYGSTGSGWDHAAYHSVRVDGTPGASNDMPTEFIWNNQPDNQQHVAHTMSLRANGDLEVKTGNVVIGTAGKGIDFSATTDGSGTDTSELLDDYEEGTWTPAVTFGGASTGVTYGTQEGRYTKIGRLVYANLHITLTSKGSSTGSFLIAGLPYNVGSRGTGSIGYYDTIGTVDDPMVLLATNPDKIAVYGSADTNAPNLTNSSLNNTSRFYFTIIYEV